MTELATEPDETRADPTDTTEPPEPEQSLEPDTAAPYGYTIDRRTGQRRPKRRAGRPKADETDQADEPGTAPSYGRSPDVDSLKSGEKIERDDDRTPSRPPRGRRTRVKRGTDRTPKEAPEVPPFRAGPIAKGVNKLYARAGKFLRVLDPEIGSALIDITRKEADDDVTVGEAWEDIAKTNPRIRAFLLKIISGGAWGQLIAVHGPILLALLMKDAIRKRIPFGKLINALLEDDEDGSPSDVSTALGGLNPSDVDQMSAVMNGMAAQMGLNFDIGQMMRGMGVPRTVVIVPEPAGDDGV
jgi:hypothetical protein